MKQVQDFYSTFYYLPVIGYCHFAHERKSILHSNNTILLNVLQVYILARE